MNGVSNVVAVLAPCRTPATFTFAALPLALRVLLTVGGAASIGSGAAVALQQLSSWHARGLEPSAVSQRCDDDYLDGYREHVLREYCPSNRPEVC
jgi:hypothetical protein